MNLKTEQIVICDYLVWQCVPRYICTSPKQKLRSYIYIIHYVVMDVDDTLISLIFWIHKYQ